MTLGRPSWPPAEEEGGEFDGKIVKSTSCDLDTDMIELECGLEKSPWKKDGGEIFRAVRRGMDHS
jgi:hypothetical protein